MCAVNLLIAKKYSSLELLSSVSFRSNNNNSFSKDLKRKVSFPFSSQRWLIKEETIRTTTLAFDTKNFQTR